MTKLHIKVTKTLIKILLIVYWIIVFIATSLPGKRLPQINILRFDKLLHFSAYMLLAFLFYWFNYISSKKKFINLKRLAIIFAIMITYSFIDEFHQKFVPGRSFEIYDLLADFGGILIGVVSARYLFFRNKTNTEND